MQPGKLDHHAFGLVEQPHVVPGLAEVHALQDGALLPDIVIASNDDDGTRHAGELLVDEVDHVTFDPGVIEEIAGDQKQIRSYVEYGIDYFSKRMPNRRAVGAVV
jgi:hypothetical protein